MTCKKCGKRINGEPEVCPRCGAPLKETVSLGAIQAAHAKKKNKKKLTPQQLWTRIGIISGSVILALLLLGVLLLKVFLPWWMDLQRPDRGDKLGTDQVGANTALPTKGIRNIALFGLDTREDTQEGRSDAMIILTIDHTHNKIKMTSLALDSLVEVEGYPSYDGKTKLTHAFSHGGVEAAVKTINQNYGMNITDYVYVNFFEFAEIIDYIGGVYIDVNTSEKSVMNNNYVPYIQSYGIDCPYVTETGYQLLNGGQALAYARNRYTGTDLDRGDRQKEVMTAAFDQIKKLPLTQYPGLLSKVLGICHSNLSSSEILDMATWAVTASPQIVNYTLPDDECDAWGGNDGSHGWVYIYDLEYATKRLHAFIYEDTLDSDIEVEGKPTTTYIPKKTTTTTTGQQLITKPTTTTTTTVVPSGTTGTTTGDSTTDPTGNGTSTGGSTGETTGDSTTDPTVGDNTTGTDDDQPVGGTTEDSSTTGGDSTTGSDTTTGDINDPTTDNVTDNSTSTATADNVTSIPETTGTEDNSAPPSAA